MKTHTTWQPDFLSDFNPLSPTDQNKLFADSVDTSWAILSGYVLFAIRFWILTETPIWNNGSDQIQNWRVLFRNTGMKGLKFFVS